MSPRKIVLSIFLIGFVLSVNAQTKKTTTTQHKTSKSDVISKEDSLEIIRELVSDLSFLFDSVSVPYSYGSASLGVGNGFFVPRNSTSSNNSNGKIYYSVAGNYVHKSGLGLQLTGLMLPENGNLNLFQTVVSPSYDYTRSKKIGFGVSYTHYFIKDSLSFHTSPLTNEFYGYISYKKSPIRPTLGLNYATGTIKETTEATRTTPSSSTTTNISDFSVIGSLSHYFSWKKLLSHKDLFVFTPTLMAVAGTSKYGTNFTMGSITNNLTRYNPKSNGKGKKKKLLDQPPIIGGSSETYTDNTAFQMQSVTAILGANYSFGKFYFQPQIFLDYTIPDADKKFNTVFNAAVGINF